MLYPRTVLVATLAVLACVTSVSADSIAEARLSGDTLLTLTIGLTHDTLDDSASFAVDSALNGAEQMTALGKAVMVQLRKTPVMTSYPLDYEHTAPYRPYEEVHKIVNTVVGVSSCDASSEYFVCGQESGTGSVLGFCCNKGMTELMEDEWWRGEQMLGEQSTLVNSFSTAHCYRMGEVLCHGYGIDQPSDSAVFTVSVAVDSFSESFAVGPRDTAYDNTTDTTTPPLYVSATLSGDYSELDEALDLSNSLVYIPAMPDTHDIVDSAYHFTTLVPRSEATLDGTECDKVGANAHMFRQEASKCAISAAGDCLHNQLYDKVRPIWPWSPATRPMRSST